MYDAFKSAVLDDTRQIQTALIYGPPLSRRGRLMNRIRRLLRLEERQELYAQWPDVVRVRLADGSFEYENAPIVPNGLSVRFTKDGTFELDDR